MKRATGLFLLLMATALTAVSLVESTSAAETKVKGRYRIHLHQGNPVEGDVTELPNGSYLVENVGGRKGISMTIERARVRRVEPLDEVKPADPAAIEASAAGPRRSPGRRRPIEGTEIEELLSGIKIEIDPESLGVKPDDLMAPLPKNEDSAREMHRLANSDKELVTDHFVMVYTGPDKQARQLASRLEAVWRWNVKFFNILKLPARRPEHKLEIFFFHKHEDFMSYSTAMGSPLPGGVLGYYRRDWNRSHFFDMETWPQTVHWLDQAKHARGAESARIRNTVNRWIDYQNIAVIQHEAGHHIHFNIGLFRRDIPLEVGGIIPKWLIEGTTMLFEFPPTQAGAGIGSINHDRLNQVRQILSARKWSAQEWKLVLLDNNLWQGAYSYPPSWAMVNYLWHEHREGYGKYLNKVFDRPPDFFINMTEREAEFEECFGRVDDKWVERFYKYLDTLRLNPLLLPPDL